jgi:tripartite-type tricarboxylate transporter receptor subunit TctC
MLAPAGTALPIINRMSEELGRAVRAPDMQKRLAEIGAVPQPSTPAEFAATLTRERERWGKLIREKGIRAE